MPIGAEGNLEVLRPPWTRFQSDIPAAPSQAPLVLCISWSGSSMPQLPSAPQGSDPALPLALQGVIDLVANNAITWDGEELGATFQASQHLGV